MSDEILEQLTLREIGILITFNSYKARNGRYPQTPEELATVTRSLLHQSRFDFWSNWFYQHTGEKAA